MGELPLAMLLLVLCFVGIIGLLIAFFVIKSKGKGKGKDSENTKQIFDELSQKEKVFNGNLKNGDIKDLKFSVGDSIEFRMKATNYKDTTINIFAHLGEDFDPGLVVTLVPPDNIELINAVGISGRYMPIFRTSGFNTVTIENLQDYWRVTVDGKTLTQKKKYGKSESDNPMYRIGYTSNSTLPVMEVWYNGKRLSWTV